MSFENFICKGVRFASKFHSEDRLKFVENEFEVYDDDVYNVTYPKSGTNWMIEILNLIKYNGDPTISQTVPVYERSPWIEIPDSAAQLDKLTRPRIISSHLPYNFFPKSFSTSKAKADLLYQKNHHNYGLNITIAEHRLPARPTPQLVIYTMRNPKDIIVSLFHFLKMHCYFEENDDFQQSIDDFLEGNVMLYGSWFDHLKGWMQMKDESRFFLNTYEELLKDHRGSVARLCKFLGKDLSDAQIDSVVKHSSFNTMKDNKMSNFTEMSSEILDQTKGSFLRKGVSGDWKNHFTVAQSEYFDRVYREKMKDLNMPFYWEQE